MSGIYIFCDLLREILFLLAYIDFLDKSIMVIRNSKVIYFYHIVDNSYWFITKCNYILCSFSAGLFFSYQKVSSLSGYGQHCLAKCSTIGMNHICKRKQRNSLMFN